MAKKGKYLRITKQIGASYLFTFITFLFSPLLILILTRTLSVKEYGVYSIFAVTIAVLSTVLAFGFPQYVLTRFPGMNKSKRLKSFFSILSFSAILLIIIGFFMLIFSSFFLHLLKLEGYNIEWVLVVFLIAISSLFALVSYYFTALKRIELKSFLDFFNKCFWIVLLIAFYLLFKYVSLKAVFALWLFGVVLSLAVSLFAMGKEIGYFLFKVKKISALIIKKALAFGLPLVPVIACSQIIAVADRYMINHFIDTSSVGIYSLAYSLVGVVFTLSIIIQNVFYPYFAELWNKRKNWSILLNAMLKYSLMVLLPLSAGLFVLRKEVITLISGPKYLAGAPIIIVLISYPLFLSLIEIFNKNLLLRGKTKLMACIYLIGAIINIILNLILIPTHGLYGAAYATIASYFVMLVLSCSIAKEIRSKLNFEFLRIARMLAAAVIMGVVIIPIAPESWFAKILTIVLGGAIYILFLFLFKVFGKEEHQLIKKALAFGTKGFKIKR